MHIFNAGGSARWGPVPFMKKKETPKYLLFLEFLVGRRDSKTPIKSGFTASPFFRSYRQSYLRFCGTAIVASASCFAAQRCHPSPHFAAD